ncbi:uncharacterized protein MYCGRDRAFT_39911 [Zymoseptoria tritici IPO323]|uniref:SnoaL-like domain-containing protein n=1 Tax=Zymoseptoria tritici (strain CBS 115943 / IPO323) TaxID=336722 RepID=F9X9S6_ZYMTI|nr:uncharacterized protein MYCGRDRAFT_39911 [Zymoseptoria tritici IPO323]EGP88153.1 hypothetical protein MYCGRDRAFT_39911 [Zymoseptoria tritici IPO323]
MSLLNSQSNHDSIRNTLATYCIALDTKDWPLLHQVFTPDVDAEYPFASLKGVEAVATAVEKRLEHVSTHHALTTQFIRLGDEGRTAKAMTYFTGVHFGEGKWKGMKVTAWGRYVDELAKVEEPGEGEMAGGEAEEGGKVWRWLITKRACIFMGRDGEEGVMAGEEG